MLFASNRLFGRGSLFLCIPYQAIGGRQLRLIIQHPFIMFLHGGGFLCDVQLVGSVEFGGYGEHGQRVRLSPWQKFGEGSYESIYVQRIIVDRCG